MENSLISITGAIGEIMFSLFGGWDVLLQTLILFMVFDYISGYVCGVTGKSPKKQKRFCIAGKVLCKKEMCLIIVLVATRLDMLIRTDFIRNAVIIGYITNEAVDIIKKAEALGLPIPAPIVKAINILIKRTEGE